MVSLAMRSLADSSLVMLSYTPPTVWPHPSLKVGDGERVTVVEHSHYEAFGYKIQLSATNSQNILVTLADS